jgi:hypothetical protein
MAETINSEQDYSKILLRIKGLTENNTAIWGKMNLSQMIEHCSIQLKLALGDLPEQKLESSFLYKTLLGRWLSLYIVPWPKGFETPSIMNMETNNLPVPVFEEGRKNLIELLKRISKEEQLAIHPFYGKINKNDWGRLIWVHLNHHLKQFNN